MNHHNRREFTRSPSRLDVEVTRGTASITGSLRDVSSGGVYVLCEHPFPETTHVSVLLVLGTAPDERIEAAGRVRRVDSHGMAIQTEEIGVRSYQHIERLVLLNSEAPAAAELALHGTRNRFPARS